MLLTEQRLWQSIQLMAANHEPYALMRGFMVPLIAALDAVPELDDRPRMALATTERWLDGTLSADELRRVWRAVPLMDNNRGEASWREAATGVFFYGNAATRLSERLAPQWYEWNYVALRLINTWVSLGEPFDAAAHRILTSLDAALKAPWPPRPAGWTYE